MLIKSLLVIASAVLSVASPAPRQKAKCSTPVLPVNGGARELAAPPAGSKLVHIALGYGIQNYSCSAVGATAASTGALAMFYDITSLYPGLGPQSLSQDAWNALTTTTVWSGNVPLNFDNSTAGRVDPTAFGASLTNPFPADAPLQLSGIPSLPFLGHHFFDVAGTPTFVLDGGAIDVHGVKNDDITAPTSADKGPDGTGAVDWLLLGSKDGSVGATTVYRVATAGGASHGCASAAGQDSSVYSAQYWFYQ